MNEIIAKLNAGHNQNAGRVEKLCRPYIFFVKPETESRTKVNNPLIIKSS
jgi:hypothetical protein